MRPLIVICSVVAIAGCAGVQREARGFPVQYLGANVPQAWAAGSVFHLLQAILGIQADAPNGRLYVDPRLPHWLPDATLLRLAVAHAQVDLRFWREAEGTCWDVVEQTGDITVEQRAWEPWQLSAVERPG